jgi:AcrR family transcriptional regulator
MRRRAELVDQTRARITEAAVRLHTTVGPSEASLSAVAEEAGVTRLTLYRHFPTRDDLFAACMGHWRALHPPPDPNAWRRVPVFDTRARRALGDLYEWYRENGDDLYPIYRDSAYTPEANQQARQANDARLVDSLLEGIHLRGAAQRRLRAAAGHVISFWTWRSLVIEQGLPSDEAVDLAVGLLLAAQRRHDARRVGPDQD